MQKSNQQTTMPSDEKVRAKFVEEIVSQTQSEFERRRNERLSHERQWELNMNFLIGNQYCDLNRKGDIVDEDKTFFWQNRGVFNHIAPIIETRLAKLSQISPVVSVRPRSDDDADVQNSTLAEKVIEEAFDRTDIDSIVRRVTAWSETCGTAFYKVIWNSQGGSKIGVYNDQPVYEGEVSFIPVSPFEIYPDSLYVERIEDCKSIMHAKAVNVSDVYAKYGVRLVGGEVDVLGLIGVGEKSKSVKRTALNSVIVIENYELPTEEFPNGRLITVAGGKLLYYGDLPYINGENGKRSFPFVKQVSISVSGSFFGASVIERLIPVQRAFNAVKNRKHEFINRLSMGVLTVEDGSVDTDDLAEEGLSPGKVLVYRQGSNPPEIMNSLSLPADFNDEEEKLLNEFIVISGVSEVSTSSNNAKISSGSALQILISQDNERMTMVAEIIRESYVLIARQVLRLYSQFLSGVKAVRTQDEFNKTKIIYADKQAFASDDVYLENENELRYTPAQKKEMIFKLYESGLLQSEQGKLSAPIKEKVLSLLGYKDLDGKKGVSGLHEEKAQAENSKIRREFTPTEEIDDHEIHIDEHTRYVLSEYAELTPADKERLFAHIREHKQKLGLIEPENKLTK